MPSTEELDMEVLNKKERSSRKIPPTYSVSLVFCHREKFRDQIFCTLSDGRYHVRTVPEMSGMFCITCSYGWLIMKSYSNSPDIYLFNPATLKNIHLPPLSCYPITEGVLTSSPTDPSCVVMLYSSKKQSLVFCRIGDKQWVEQRHSNKNPIQIKHLASAISCKGKIYLLYQKRIAIIHNIYDTSAAAIEQYFEIEPPSHSPHVGTVSHVISYYLESDGEIFQVIELMFGMSDIVMTFDVFKMDLSTLSWVEVESLGDRIFLLSKNGSMSVSATESGLKENSIYFVVHGHTSLYRFDMCEGTITETLPCPTKLPFWGGPFWVVPDCKLQVISETTDMMNANEKVNQERTSEDLPTELLYLISSSLSLGDCIRFRLTCKSLISVTPPLRLNHLPMQPESGSQFPWLISFPKSNNGVCNFYHPVCSDAYTMNFPELAGALLYNARYGWLLMSKRKSTCIFLFNPFTMEIVNLPELEDHDGPFQSMFFSSPPTSSDFVVFGLVTCTIMLVYQKAENTWCTYSLRGGPDFYIFSFPCNPIFYGGVFYFLCTDGRLALFNPKAIEEESQWEVFPESALYCWSPYLGATSIRNFIVEYNGEILAVFVGLRGKPIDVFKLDHMKMKWDRLETLDDKVLFLSHSASIMMPTGLKGIENRIYFPRQHGQDNLFYSLSTRNYHSFGRKDSRGDWLNTSEHWYCAWIHPTA